MEEIRERLATNLNKQGILPSLKVRKRLKEAQSQELDCSMNGTEAEHSVRCERRDWVLHSEEGVSVAALVREFLTWCELFNTVKVFDSEIAYSEGWGGRSELMHQLALGEERDQPLLLSVLQAYLQHQPDTTCADRSVVTSSPDAETRPGNSGGYASQRPGISKAALIKAARSPAQHGRAVGLELVRGETATLREPALSPAGGRPAVPPLPLDDSPPLRSHPTRISELGEISPSRRSVEELKKQLQLQLPRPRWLEASGRSGALLYVTPPGLFFRRAALVFHGAYLVRDIWNYVSLPGAAHGFLPALWNLLCGRGFTVPQQKLSQLGAVRARGHHRHHHHGHSHNHAEDEQLDWYVDASDLELFKERVEKIEPPPGVSDWEPMMDKDFGNFTYTAWRRSLPNGKTEYKSVTVASNATAEEFTDFYFDDRTRPHWDSMISDTEVLENGPGKHRCQVVRWVRSFPFSFISKREYVIGRRMFKEHGCQYGITKAVTHPRAVDNPGIVRMEEFYSMWRSRTIPDPKGGADPACETVLLHHEQFKIPENLSRFAVRHGMAGFVKKMGPDIERFVAERRQRCPPFEHDPDAFGVNTVPNPPLRSEYASSASSVASCSDSEDAGTEARATGGRRHGRSGQRARRRPVRLAAAAAAGVAAVLFVRKK